MNNSDIILKYFYEKPTEKYHIRGLARLTKLSPNTIINLVDKLIKSELLMKEIDKYSNRIFLKPNYDKEYFKIQKKMYNISKLFSSGLIDYLNDKYYYPTMVIFGSIAKSEENKNSDIDLFILSDNIKNVDLKKYEKKLNRKIEIFLHNPSSWKQLKIKNKELANNIINGITLKGFLEVL